MQSMSKGGVTLDRALSGRLSSKSQAPDEKLSQDHLTDPSPSPPAASKSQTPGVGRGGEGRAAPYLLAACHLVIRYLLLSLAPPSAEFNESEKNYEVP